MDELSVCQENFIYPNKWQILSLAIEFCIRAVGAQEPEKLFPAEVLA